MPFHGSLVMYESPSWMRCGPMSSMKLTTAAAMVLTWPGVPVTAWAIMRPRVSYTPADRSPASRTLVEKAVRTSASACSSTMEIRRFHITWLRSSLTTRPVPRRRRSW